jgi:hypothetical protein
MMSLATGDKLAQMLFDMRWSLSKAEHGFFITCDNPLVQWVDPESVHPIYGDGGFTNPRAQVTLALDPRTLLILSWDEASPERFVMTRDGVDARAWHAEEFLYSHVEHEDIARLAKRFKGSRPKVTTEGLGPERFAEVAMPRKWKQKSASKRPLGGRPRLADLRLHCSRIWGVPHGRPNRVGAPFGAAASILASSSN